MINPPKSLLEEFEKYLANISTNDIDRQTYLFKNLNDTQNKIIVTIIFLRDWDSLDSDSYSSVIVNNVGAVFCFPCYWLSVPKELANPYFEYVLSSFYNEHVTKWLEPESSSPGCPCIPNAI